MIDRLEKGQEAGKQLDGETQSPVDAEDPSVARVVELRHFGGPNHEQIAAALGITIYEARQKWTYARTWLLDTLGD